MPIYWQGSEECLSSSTIPRGLEQASLFGHPEILLNVTKAHSTNVNFTLEVVLGLGDNLVGKFFLTLEFDVIFKLFVIEDNGYQLRTFFAWESIVSKS